RCLNGRASALPPANGFSIPSGAVIRMDTATESRIEELSWLPFLLQTADALFPTGAYAHSLGFEEIVRLGVVQDEGTLRDFLLRQVAPAQERLELPYLRFAF